MDRGVANADWALLFPSAELHHLPRVKSDHCPIMLTTGPLGPKPAKPFLFKHMWLTDPTFPSLVQDSWRASEMIPSTSSSLSRFPRRLDALTDSILSWNKNHFGNIF